MMNFLAAAESDPTTWPEAVMLLGVLAFMAFFMWLMMR